VVLIAISQKYKASSSCRSFEINSGLDSNVSEVQSLFIHFVDQVRSVVVLIEMSQKYKDSLSCRSGEISNGVDNNVSEVERQFIL
jgi:hypothetical protein